MADDSMPTGSGSPNGSEPEFVMQAVYLKDCSFEAPKGPRIEGQWNPQISLDLNTNAEAVSDEQREVVLTVSVTVKNADVTAFLVEVKQAGLFTVRNLGEADYQRAVAVVAPNVLFPYSRALIAQLCALGGFPQLLLPPVNFDALFAQTVAQAQAGSTARN